MITAPHGAILEGSIFLLSTATETAACREAFYNIVTQGLPRMQTIDNRFSFSRFRLPAKKGRKPAAIKEMQVTACQSKPVPCRRLWLFCLCPWNDDLGDLPDLVRPFDDDADDSDFGFGVDGDFGGCRELLQQGDDFGERDVFFHGFFRKWNRNGALHRILCA
jgi:hypothetical protein